MVLNGRGTRIVNFGRLCYWWWTEKIQFESYHFILIKNTINCRYGRGARAQNFCTVTMDRWRAWPRVTWVSQRTAIPRICSSGEWSSILKSLFSPKVWFSVRGRQIEGFNKDLIRKKQLACRKGRFYNSLEHIR